MATPSIKLPADLDRELMALVKERKSTRAKVLRDALRSLSEKKSAKAPKRAKGTIGELAADLIGSVEGPGDLLSNPKYMAGYGK
jgi:metal-responsive CopG/Arc/MetJ family transcriptional regulator